MSGIFYDPANRSLHHVSDAPQRGWRLITHDMNASTHQCRRIMREWLSTEDLNSIQWATGQSRH